LRTNAPPGRSTRDDGDVRLDPDECRKRFAAADHAVLAVNGSDGAPLVVPTTFALMTSSSGDVLTFAVDHKPKSTTRLRRLELIAKDPAVAVLVEHYDDDWSRLWWVRADGHAEILTPADDGPGWGDCLAALTRAYPPYRDTPPTGDVVRIGALRWTGWAGER
jgi:PPOX class probable F420-dependent enzyme